MKQEQLWKHFSGKIYNIVTYAKGMMYREVLIVLQDVKSLEVFVLPVEEFEKRMPGNIPRFTRYKKTISEAVRGK